MVEGKMSIEDREFEVDIEVRRHRDRSEIVEV
jgi:hypothetical protein